MTARTTYTLRGLLHSAGIPATVVEVPNQYCPETPNYDDVRTPWLRVFTELGVIVIGWRKNVIEIDWSDSTIDVHGRDVVENESVTHDDRMCHAWGYDEAAACLLRLWTGAPHPSEHTPGGDLS